MNADDRLEILDLLSGYSYGFDESEFERLEDIFAPEAVIVTSDGSQLTSNTEIRTRIEAIRGERAERGIQTRHHQTNTLLTEIEDGVVSGRTVMFVAWQHDGEPAPRPVHSGLYLDEFRKLDGRWRITRREIQFDHD